MKFMLSMFVDAFVGSGVPLAGDPITSFQNISLLGLRTGTVVDNRKPTVRDVVKVRIIATNCGHRPIEIVPLCEVSNGRDREPSENNVITLVPGASIQHSIFRSWEAPGERQLSFSYEARCDSQPFARLTYPSATVHVRPAGVNGLIYWVWCLRAAYARAQWSERWGSHSVIS